MIPWQVGLVAVKKFIAGNWKLLVIVAAALAAVLWFRNVTYSAAYKDASELYDRERTELEQIWTDQITNDLEARDEYWTALLERERARVADALADNKRIREQQAALKRDLEKTEADLASLREEYENADFGTAAFSDDADGLLNAAYSAAFGDAAPDGT